MHTGPLLKLKSLSLLCASVLLVCSSLSLFCPMAMDPVEAASHPMPHALDEEGGCFEALGSSASHSGELIIHILLPQAPHTGCMEPKTLIPVPLIFQTAPWPKGPPRYLLLSTFLI